MTDKVGGEPSPLRVRPYMMTRGRTRTDVELGLETMIHVTSAGRDGSNNLSRESRKIVELCAEPLSVAEISAHLRIPLQVAKILTGDLVSNGLVATHTGSTQPDGRPDLALLERVLDGLQSL